MIRELAKSMLSADVLSSNNGVVSFLEGPPEQLPRCERVLMLQALLLDHLQPLQQVILKTSSIIGEEFKFSTLMDVFPLEVRRAVALSRCRAVVCVFCVVGVPAPPHPFACCSTGCACAVSVCSDPQATAGRSMRRAGGFRHVESARCTHRCR